ncbi:peptidase M50, partial [Mycolicibacter senuensis]
MPVSDDTEHAVAAAIEHFRRLVVVGDDPDLARVLTRL